MKILKHILSYLVPLGLVSILCSQLLPYGNWQRMSLYVCGISFGLDFLLQQRWKTWSWQRENYINLVWIAVFLLVPIWQLFDPMRTVMFEREQAILLPFLIYGGLGLFGIRNQYRIEWFAWGMLVTGAIVALLLFYHAGPIDEQWLQRVNQYRAISVQAHMTANMYWNISLVLGLYTLLRTRYHWLIKLGTAALMLLVLAGILTSDGRTGQITLLLLLTMSCAVAGWRYLRWKGVWIAIPVLALAISVMIGLNDRLRWESIRNSPRTVQWELMAKVIGEKPLLGHGICSSREKYLDFSEQDERCQQIYYPFFYQQLREQNMRPEDVDRYVHHPHSAWLDAWGAFGLVGLTLMVLLVLLPVCLYRGEARFYLAACVLVWFVQSLFEVIGSNCLPELLILPTLIWTSLPLRSFRDDRPASRE